MGFRYRYISFAKKRYRLLSRHCCCAYCGATTNLTIDHIFPKSLGGTDRFCNLQVLCGACNHEKGCKVDLSYSTAPGMTPVKTLAYTQLYEQYEGNLRHRNTQELFHR